MPFLSFTYVYEIHKNNVYYLFKYKPFIKYVEYQYHSLLLMSIGNILLEGIKNGVQKKRREVRCKI